MICTADTFQSTLVLHAVCSQVQTQIVQLSWQFYIKTRLTVSLESLLLMIPKALLSHNPRADDNDSNDDALIHLEQHVPAGAVSHLHANPLRTMYQFNLHHRM